MGAVPQTTPWSPRAEDASGLWGMTTRADLLRTIKDAERGGDYQLAERLRAELAKRDRRDNEETPNEDDPRPALR